MPEHPSTNKLTWEHFLQSQHFAPNLAKGWGERPLSLNAFEQLGQAKYSEIELNNPNFIKIAEAYGGHVFVVNSRNELEERLKVF